MSFFRKADTQKVFFTLTPLPEGRDIYDVVGKVEDLSREPSVDGILEMAVLSDPDRVRVHYDAHKNNSETIKLWLIKNGIEID